jgi:putative heme-binding domain-containing protein
LWPRRLRLEGYYGSAAEPQNPWGFVFTKWGEPIELAGNNHSIIYPVPGLVPGGKPGQPALIWPNGHGRKMSGGEIVETAHFPDAWQGRLVIGGYLNNALWALVIRDDGSGFALEDAPPLLTSSDSSFRPVDVRFGPDGALYICDWCNPIIGHYQASFRHPDRDRTRGRIWRITAKNRPLTAPPNLIAATTAELLEQLKSPDGWTREFASRLLAGRPDDEVVAAMVKWLGEGQRDPTFPGMKLSELELKEALGVLQSHEAVEAGRPVLEKLCRVKEAGARAYAASVVGLWADRLPDALDLVRLLVADENPRVRLQAVVACARIARAEAVETALMAADFPTDKFLDYAIDQAVHALKRQWLPDFRAGRLTFGGQSHRLIRFVRADGSPETVRMARDLLRGKNLDGARREGLWRVLIEAGNADDLASVLRIDDDALLERLLPAVTQAARIRSLRPAGDLTSLLQPLVDKPPTIRDAALQLAGAWKVEAMRGVLIAQSFTSAGLDALVSLDPAAAAFHAAERLASSHGAQSAEMILPPFFHRAGALDRLVEAMKSKPPSREAARSALQILNERGFQSAALTKILTGAAQLGTQNWTYSPEFANQLAAEVRAMGDGARGAAVFQRPELTCVACHAVGERGGTLGPTLDGIGSAQPVDFIIGAVLAPQKEVKESYQAVQVTMKEGEIVTGFRAGGDGADLALRDPAQNKIIHLARSLVAEEKNLGSLMPTGLVNSLSRQEMRDLFRYLAELGKSSP